MLEQEFFGEYGQIFSELFDQYPDIALVVDVFADLVAVTDNYEG